MSRHYYNSKLKNECHRLYVQEEWDAARISKKYKNNPCQQTVNNWISFQPDNGESWKQERQRKMREGYEQLSPQEQAKAILSRINFLLMKNPADLTTKDADALAKYQKFYEKMVDKSFQIPMMYELLTKLLEFLKLHYDHILTEELVNAVKHFKNQLLESFE